MVGGTPYRKIRTGKNVRQVLHDVLAVRLPKDIMNIFLILTSILLVSFLLYSSEPPRVSWRLFGLS